MHTCIVFHQVMQGGEGETWRDVDPAVVQVQDAVVLHTVIVGGVVFPQDRQRVTI